MAPVLSGLHCVIASTYFDPAFLNLFGKGAVGRYHGLLWLDTILSSFKGCIIALWVLAFNV
jgi:hypothetical protein